MIVSCLMFTCLFFRLCLFKQQNRYKNVYPYCICIKINVCMININTTSWQRKIYPIPNWPNERTTTDHCQVSRLSFRGPKFPSKLLRTFFLDIKIQVFFQIVLYPYMICYKVVVGQLIFCFSGKCLINSFIWPYILLSVVFVD